MTYHKVNERRLADGEVRVLHDGDRVAFTPLPFDLRVSAKRDRIVYAESRLGNKHALEFVYTQYAMDDFQAKLSDCGNAVRRSISEFSRIRRLLQSTRSSRCAYNWKEIESLSLISAPELILTPWSHVQAVVLNQHIEVL